MFASPLNLMPAKDTLEELFLGQERRMTGSENLVCTFSVVSICYLGAVCIPDISDIMTVAGATSTPAVGFCLPLIFWLKTDHSPTWSMKRLIALIVNVMMIGVGIFSLISFINRKISSN